MKMNPLQTNNMVNGMSVDVEDYFHAARLEQAIPRQDWDRVPCRVESNTVTVLDLFDRAQIKATFFMLGWVAERYSSLVLEIVNRGHELASYGYSHFRATTQTPAEFRDDIVRAKHLLEDISGQAVIGYRAPSYSINETNLWAFEELEKAGFQYSSSIYPIRHDIYGMPGAPRFAYYPRKTGILEIPITTMTMFGKNLPMGGGGYFRFFPYFVSQRAIRYINNQDRQSSVFYFHPWEIDPKQPRQTNISAKSKFCHYLNLDKMQDRLLQLLADFQWSRIDKLFLGKSS